jgi:hypothetical protein
MKVLPGKTNTGSGWGWALPSCHSWMSLLSTRVELAAPLAEASSRPSGEKAKKPVSVQFSLAGKAGRW